MNMKWFQDPNHIIPISMEEFVDQYQNLFGIDNLRFKIEAFRENPKKEGEVLTGSMQTSFKLFVPKLAFDERMEKDENIWVYLGPSQPCFCLEKTEPWRGKAYFCFTHKECEYYPCHEVSDPEQFNCLFCFCPLYSLGSRCGGKFPLSRRYERLLRMHAPASARQLWIYYE